MGRDEMKVLLCWKVLIGAINHLFDFKTTTAMLEVLSELNKWQRLCRFPIFSFFFFWVLISHPPKNTQKIHSWAKRMCLDVEELVGCTAQKLPYHVWALARTRSRGWVEDAELDGDVSGLLRSTGTKLLWWCFLLWDFLVNTQMLDILGRALL